MTLDIDAAVEKHNEGVSEVEKITRQDVIDHLATKEIKITDETVRNYKAGKVPKAFRILKEVHLFTKVPLKDLLK